MLQIPRAAHAVFRAPAVCLDGTEAGLFSLEDRALGFALGLGDLDDGYEVCHGYATGCVCLVCSERESPTPTPSIGAQPWEVACRA